MHGDRLVDHGGGRGPERVDLRDGWVAPTSVLPLSGDWEQKFEAKSSANGRAPLAASRRRRTLRKQRTLFSTKQDVSRGCGEAHSPMASTVVRGSGSPPDPAGAYLGTDAAISTASAWESTMVFGFVAGRPMHMTASFPGRRVLQTCSDSMFRVRSSVPKSCHATRAQQRQGRRNDLLL